MTARRRIASPPPTDPAFPPADRRSRARPPRIVSLVAILVLGVGLGGGLADGLGAAPAAPGAAVDDGRPLAFEDLIEVSEVFLDVLVTDADGRPVTGLGAADFDVREDGEEVPITGLAYYGTRYGAGGSAETPPESRYFVVFVHDLTRFGYFGGDLVRQQIRLGRDLGEWVEGGLLPSDWVAVVSYDTRLHLHQDFTQDRQALLAAIAAAAAGRAPQAGRGGGDGPLAVLARMPGPVARRTAVDDVYDALRLVAEATGVLVGRKDLLLFTPGIGRRVGRGAMTVLDPQEVEPLEATLNDHNVAVYPIDITPPGKSHAYAAALEDLAARTGGVYHARFVGFRSPLEEISAESSGYYLLSYQTAHPAGEVGYQRVEVKARRPDLVVRARRGYRYGR